MNTVAALNSADYGFGERIIRSLMNITPDGHSCLDAVKGRETKDWIFRLPDGIDTASALRAVAGVQGNRSRLPIITYSRLEGLNTVSLDEAVNDRFTIPVDSDALKQARVDCRWLELNYKVTMIGATREAAETLMLMWFFHIAGGGASIDMKYAIGSSEVSLKGFVKDPQTLLTTPASIPEQKIYALSQDVIVQAPCLFGQIIDAPETVRVGFNFLQVS